MDTEKFLFKAFGFIIRSDYYFKELSFLINEDNLLLADIDIRIEDLSTVWREEGEIGKFNVKKNQTLFQVKDTAVFCVKDGNEILVSPFKESDQDKVKLYILGTCMGILLIQREVLPLHGSAISIAGKAYAIVGDSGAGKSTLASEFMKRGYDLLTDDIIPVIITSEGKPTVVPSYPQQKLWIESLRQFGMDSSKYRPLFDREEKFSVPLKNQFCNTSLPLGGVFELVKSVQDGIEIAKITKLNKLQILSTHTYRNQLISRSEKLEWHFKVISELATNTFLYQLRRPPNCFTAADLADQILYQINKEEPLHA
ncbi:aldolase [Guptibacillus spartinae]|uniref:aldolase n=1 Tax=Guptibacillus spartinae TaxID=3025679 RepID=UPI00235FE105|nr:aldolase [Pseudalkalibacillus spartinae]